MIKDIFKFVENNNVLFITTKNIDYIRNSQEINILQNKTASLKILGFKDKKYFSRLLKLFIKILFLPFDEFDVIFIGFSPQLILPFWYYRFRKKIVIVDFFISLHDTFVFDRQKVHDKSIVGNFLYYLDRKTLVNATYIVTDCVAHAKFFSSEYSIPINKMGILYLEADTTVYYPRPQVKVPPFYGKYVVNYFGSILNLQGIEIILQAAYILKDNHEILFDIIGPVKKRDYKFKNIIFTTWLSQDDLASRIALADLCLAGHFNAEIAKASRTIPGKAFIYEAMGKPMILGDNPANHEQFLEDNRHYFVKMGNAEVLAKKIMEIKNHKCF